MESKNCLTSFDANLIPSSLDYLDITNNEISNNTILFGELQITTLYYDTDNENKNKHQNNTKISDAKSELETSSTNSDLSSIKLNFLKHYYESNEINVEDDEVDDEEINNAINEYENDNKDIGNNNIGGDNSNDEMENNSNALISCEPNSTPFQIAVLENTTSMTHDAHDACDACDEQLSYRQINHQLYSNDIQNQRDLMLKSAIERFKNRNSENNNFNSYMNNNIKNNEKVYSRIIPVELKWNFVLTQRLFAYRKRFLSVSFFLFPVLRSRG